MTDLNAAADTRFEIRTGAFVVATDGEVGRIDGVVVSPETGAVEGLVVRAVPQLGRDLLIPIDAVADANEDLVRLRLTREDLMALPALDQHLHTAGPRLAVLSSSSGGKRPDPTPRLAGPGRSSDRRARSTHRSERRREAPSRPVGGRRRGRGRPPRSGAAGRDDGQAIAACGSPWWVAGVGHARSSRVDQRSTRESGGPSRHARATATVSRVSDGRRDHRRRARRPLVSLRPPRYGGALRERPDRQWRCRAQRVHPSHARAGSDRGTRTGGARLLDVRNTLRSLEDLSVAERATEHRGDAPLFQRQVGPE